MVALRALLALLFVVQAARAADPPRFAAEIAAFERADKTNPPPKNAILFIGSSSIVRWKTLAEDFPGHQVFNRGFGGSYMSDSVFYFDRIVAPYQPRTIFLYEGSNDINAGKTPQEVFDDFKAFSGKVRAAFPGTWLYFISIAPSPSRWKEVQQVKEANRLIQDYIGQNERLGFIDVFPAMLGSDGRPKPDIYVADRLHMNANGYKIWRAIVGPYLNK